MRVVWLRKWAERLIASRPPNYIIGDAADPYMLRWYVIPRNLLFNVYLHRLVRSDDARALHDHPWINMSILLDNSYIEHTIAAGGVHYQKVYSAGDWRLRTPRSAHRLEINREEPVLSLFITGPRVREWGFHCAEAGWRSHKIYVMLDGIYSKIGRGCD